MSCFFANIQSASNILKYFNFSRGIFTLKIDGSYLEDPVLSAFWSSISSVEFDALSTVEVEVDFLPFHIGSLQCSILFLNEHIGEFIYSIEAKSTLPLPFMVPFHKGHEGSRVTSATAALHSQGLLKDDNIIIYLHCEAEKSSDEELLLIAENAAKEKALGMCQISRSVKLMYYTNEIIFTIIFTLEK